MIDRRAILRSLAVVLGCATLPVLAQALGRPYRLGILLASAPFEGSQAARIPLELRELGYVEGGNLIVERRYAERRVEHLPALARELVEWRADVIVAVGLSAVHAVQRASSTIPTVMVINVDPVTDGLVKSLARPGGNLTGVSITAEGTLAAKRLEFLKEAVPGASRIAFLAPDDPAVAMQVAESRKAAATLGVALIEVTIGDRDYEKAFATIVRAGADAVFVAATPNYGSDRKRLLDLAASKKLPAMWEWREQVIAGGFITYGSSLAGTYKKVAAYVDRILKGANPADMPIEQPSKFELVINLRTAKALGINVPQSLLLRADEVIQ